MNKPDHKLDCTKCSNCSRLSFKEGNVPEITVDVCKAYGKPIKNLISFATGDVKDNAYFDLVYCTVYNGMAVKEEAPEMPATDIPL